MSGRRDFLRGLATLPLIGGGVALIGKPTAVAEPASALALAHYANWLLHEQRILCIELAKGDIGRAMAMAAADLGPQPEFHYPREPGKFWPDVPMPSTRATLVMTAVGFDWRNDAGARKVTALQMTCQGFRPPGYPFSAAIPIRCRLAMKIKKIMTAAQTRNDHGGNSTLWKASRKWV